MESKTIIVLSGSPAAGKSSLIQSLNSQIPLEILKIDSILNTFPDFSSENYHKAREILIQNTEFWIKSAKSGYLIIEDTNHLKSLVKPFRVLCKVYQLPFVHFVLDVELEVAIERNKMRDQQVPLVSLEKIFSQIKMEKFYKESFAFDSSQVCLGDLLWRIRNAVILRPYEDEKKCEEAGYKHMIDCKLRKTIKFLVDNHKGEKKTYAKLLTQTKSHLLKGIKSLNINSFLLEYEKISNILNSL